MTFGEQPRLVTIAQVFFLASGQDRRQTHRRYFFQAANTGVRSTVPKHSELGVLTLRIFQIVINQSINQSINNQFRMDFVFYACSLLRSVSVY